MSSGEWVNSLFCQPEKIKGLWGHVWETFPCLTALLTLTALRTLTALMTQVVMHDAHNLISTTLHLQAMSRSS